MLRLGIDPEKLYRATFICQDGLCCCNMALISFRLFRKNWATCEIFLGKWFTAPPPPPPLAKNFPYAYVSAHHYNIVKCQNARRKRTLVEREVGLATILGIINEYGG